MEPPETAHAAAHELLGWLTSPLSLKIAVSMSEAPLFWRCGSGRTHSADLKACRDSQEMLRLDAASEGSLHTMYQPLADEYGRQL